MLEDEYLKEIDEYFDSLSTDEFLEITKRNGLDETVNIVGKTKTRIEELKEIKKILEEKIVRVLENSASIVSDVRSKINQIDCMIEESYEKEKKDGDKDE
jgi:hypothetical protein